jgi:hypothetical protein
MMTVQEEKMALLLLLSGKESTKLFWCIKKKKKRKKKRKKNKGKGVSYRLTLSQRRKESALELQFMNLLL